MRWGSELETLVEMWEETGKKPPALERRPKLLEPLKHPYRIWESLAGSRPPSFSGIARIPFSEFFVYARAFGYSGDPLLDLWETVSLVDSTFVAEFNDYHNPKK